MNERESRELSQYTLSTDPPETFAGTVKWLAVWVGGIILCGVAFIQLMQLGELMQLHPVIGPIVLAGVILPIGLVAIICLYAIILLIEEYFNSLHFHRECVRDEIPKIKAALQDGRVFVKRVVAEAVIEILGFDDAAYIYDVGGGRIFFLKGQWVLPIDEEMTWPNSDFEIVRTVHGKKLIGIFCYGQELKPVGLLDMEDCVDEVIFSDREEVLDRDLEQFAKSITKVA